LFDVILQADSDLPITRSLYALFPNQRVVSEYRAQSFVNVVLCIWGFNRPLSEVAVLWGVKKERSLLLPSSV
jgi:hypothetical protein